MLLLIFRVVSYHLFDFIVSYHFWIRTNINSNKKKRNHQDRIKKIVPRRMNSIDGRCLWQDFLQLFFPFTQIRKPFVILYFSSPVDLNKRKEIERERKKRTRKRFFVCFCLVYSYFYIVFCSRCRRRRQEKSLFIKSCFSFIFFIIKKTSYVVCMCVCVCPTYNTLPVYTNIYLKKSNFKIKKKNEKENQETTKKNGI